jgi:hypothetical protein
MSTPERRLHADALDWTPAASACTEPTRQLEGEDEQAPSTLPSSAATVARTDFIVLLGRLARQAAAYDAALGGSSPPRQSQCQPSCGPEVA